MELHGSYRVGVAGTKITTLNLLADMERSSYPITHLITLSDGLATRMQVAGCRDLVPYSTDKGIATYLPRTYSLQDPEDQRVINAWHLDVLLVMGWERLIPNAVLQGLRIGAFGMHGSPWGLPRGRGRSPMNWSLILGEAQFKTYLFQFNAGVDEGEFVDSMEFDILPSDTIQTLHFKNRVAMFRLLEKHLGDILRGEFSLIEQVGMPTYFPKRAPEDGGIDWTCSETQVCDLIRAVTAPYPGAFTFQDGRRLNIWRAQPLGRLGDYRAARPGEVVETSAEGLFVVRSGSGSVLVVEWAWADGNDSVPPPREEVLDSVSAVQTLENIVLRYPEWINENQKEIRAS